MKTLLAAIFIVGLVSANSRAQTLVESTNTPEVGVSDLTSTVRGSVRFEAGVYELAHNYAPGQFSYVPLGGDPELLAGAVGLMRQISEEQASTGNYLYGLYEPLVMKIRQQPDGSLVLLSFSRNW